MVVQRECRAEKHFNSAINLEIHLNVGNIFKNSGLIFIAVYKIA